MVSGAHHARVFGQLLLDDRRGMPSGNERLTREGEEVVDGLLEVWTSSGRSLLPLGTGRCTVGSSPESDVVIDDSSVSRAHAVLEQFASAWFIEDLGSRNGTYLNGQRVTGRRLVRSGDEIRLGLVRVAVRSDDAGGGTRTSAADEPPVLTRRERDVLVALCQPLLAGDAFTEPASIREVAALLVVSDAAVKQHLANLFAKFGILDGEHRRVRLANAALSTGAVTLGDLRQGA